MKRLLLVIPLPPPVHGSNIMNRHVAENKKLLKNYTVKVFPLHYASANDDIGKRPIVKLLKALKYYAQFLKLNFKPDIIYFVPAVTGLPFYRDFVFSLFLKAKTDHLVIHLHGKGIKKSLKNHLARIIYGSFFKNAYIIHLSKRLLYDLNGVIAGSRNVFILPNGVDVSPPVNKSIVQVSKDRVDILFLSNLYVAKGVFLLLDAARILNDKHLNFFVHIVGNPTREISRKCLEETIREKGVEDVVMYHGPKYGEEKRERLEQADIFTLPTWYEKECFPLTIIEAMAFRLPVVSTEIAAIPEMVDHGATGYLVKPGSAESVADSLEILIRQPEIRRTMGEKAFQKYKEQYTIAKFDQSLVEMMDTISS